MAIPKSELMRRLRERRRAEKLAVMPARACQVCGKPLPATARADAKCCSADCRARRSRATLAALALSPAEVAELHAALGSLLAEVPNNGRTILTRGGLRFRVTKWGADFLVEGKGGRPRLHACYRADGAARRYQKAPRFERAMHEALRPLLPPSLEHPIQGGQPLPPAQHARGVGGHPPALHRLHRRAHAARFPLAQVPRAQPVPAGW
jgi:hypothetical protein